MSKILIVDDQKSICNSLQEILEREGHTCTKTCCASDALTEFQSGEIDLVVSDVEMQGMSGIDLLGVLHQDYPQLPVIMISGKASVGIAVECLKRGAADFIEKPIDLNRVLSTVKLLLEKQPQTSDSLQPPRKLTKPPGVDIIGNSAALKEVLNRIDRVSFTDARVLITGKNGTGKELAARLIHLASARSEGPYIEVNCAAIPSELIESELFGHEKGSFTNAFKQRKGKFEQAEGGTIFLDEIGDMSLSAQAKVLRALQEKKISRVGSDKDICVNVRVIAATNKNLPEEIKSGRFREDLYHRLSVIGIELPPLCDRREDIPLLVDHFLKVISKEQSRSVPSIENEAVAALVEKPWTGNIRELRNCVERLMILSHNPNKITIKDVTALI